jgi:hypothetical protein
LSMAVMPPLRTGPPPRSFAADAHACIMVWVRTRPTGYKVAARLQRPTARLPSDTISTAHWPVPGRAHERHIAPRPRLNQRAVVLGRVKAEPDGGR